MEKISVSICCGTTCNVLGAPRAAELLELLPRDLADLVEVSETGCAGLCKGGKTHDSPYVRIGEKVIAKATLPGIVGEIELIAEEAAITAAT